MSVKRLKPIIDHPELSDEATESISQYLYDLLYAPLFELLEINPDEKYNAKYGAVITAINTDRLVYRDGYFTGAFNSYISRELRGLGATWDKTRKAFKLPLSGLPMEIKQAVSASGVRADQVKARMEDILDNINTRKIPSVDFITALSPMIDNLEGQFKKTTGKDIEVPMELDSHQRARIIFEYQENANTALDGWKLESVKRLRKKVAENVVEGFRADKLAKQLQADYGMSKRKAKQVASQETSLLVSKYRQVRYESVGLSKYTWSTSRDRRVRASHKALDGRTFSWDSPPIVDPATGRRGHPGTDFGCRCVAIPIITEA